MKLEIISNYIISLLTESMFYNSILWSSNDDKREKRVSNIDIDTILHISALRNKQTIRNVDKWKLEGLLFGNRICQLWLTWVPGRLLSPTAGGWWWGLGLGTCRDWRSPGVPCWDSTRSARAPVASVCSSHTRWSEHNHYHH